MENKPTNFSKLLSEKSRLARFQDFHNLIRFRVRDILLVSSLYDSYLFEEDGRLYEQIRKEYQGLNLTHSPELVQVSSGEEAIRMARDESRFDLIITTLHIEDMSALTFARRVRESGLDTPIVLLGYDNREMLDLISNQDTSIFEKVFIWQGDYRIIFGIIKYLEDKKNVEQDTRSVGVQSIILIEDSVRFYSSYLPLIYRELLKQSQSLILEGVNLTHKILRQRARPKILLATNYEEAWDYFMKYEKYILGVISDIDFFREGKQDPYAGVLFAKEVKSRQPDIPVLLQSTMPANGALAANVGASFLLKGSPTLLEDLKNFMIQYFSFGDFIFRDANGNEVGRASNLAELEDQLRVVPDESIVYHASRNHFSNWLKARTEFWLAYQLRPKKVTDFPSVAALRQLLIDYLSEFRKSRQIGVISDFDKKTFDASISFARIGGGSIGGKARGLGFINSLISNFEIRHKFDGVKIFVPAGVVIATDVFDQFLEENNLRDFALRSQDDAELKRRFFDGTRLPDYVEKDLRDFLEIVKDPLAVRSSSLMEDSQGQPFAGVYDTFMIPNNHPNIETRLEQLIDSIKRIYVSIFFKRSKDYIKVTSYRLEEEKMAVIIQKVVGAEHNGKYYPEISGVAKSYNFYPVPPLKSKDGILSVALGLGKIIVEGGNTIRFCPKYPQNLLQLSTIEDLLNYSPNVFYAIDLTVKEFPPFYDDEYIVKNYTISEAEKDGTLSMVGSSYSQENNKIYDNIDREGIKLFTLAPMIKYKLFPLPEIIQLLLEMGTWGTGSPVEIEFAVNLSVPAGKPKEFALLQMRPLVISHEIEELEITSHSKNELLCSSGKVLGHGVISNIKDIVYVDVERFDRSKSREVALEISQFNNKLVHAEKPYLLIGVGRWGSLDPWLGIPVTWDQINGAKTIIEANFRDFNVTPSQGSHFFQNLTSFKVGYFTVDQIAENGFVDWEWLAAQRVFESKKFTKHVVLKKPLTIKINGQKNKGIILKPN